MAIQHIKGKRKKDLIFYIVTLAIPVVQFCIFYLAVNFNSILMMFQEFVVDGEDAYFKFLGWSRIFKNFTSVFKEWSDGAVFLPVLKNSFIAYFVSLIAGTGLALVFSFYVYKKFPLHGFVKVVLFTPSIISGVVLVSIFHQFVDIVIPDIFEIFGKQVDGLIANPNTRFGTILFYCIWVGFGGSILLYVGAMNNISESISEACKLDGANLFQEMLYIVLPLIYPTLVTFLVVGVSGIFTNQLAIFAIYGPGASPHIWTFGYYLFKETQGAEYARYPELATMGILMTLIVAPLTFLVKWGLEKVGPSQE